MALITLLQDNIRTDVWWMSWVEEDEIIGQVIQDTTGRYRVASQGPHWSPMKSFAGYSFESREAALAEVQLYFRGR